MALVSKTKECLKAAWGIIFIGIKDNFFAKATEKTTLEAAFKLIFLIHVSLPVIVADRHG